MANVAELKSGLLLIKATVDALLVQLESEPQSASDEIKEALKNIPDWLSGKSLEGA